MCGIFGVVLKADAAYPDGFWEASLRLLGKESQSRGRDSSGLVVRDHRDLNFKVFKGAVPLTALLSSPEIARFLDGFEPSGTAIGIGHSRLVTNGSQLTPDNNQPVVKNNLIGVHNGIIVNDIELWDAHPGLTREYEIDTEVFLALVRSSLDGGADVATAVERAVAGVEGTVSTALLIPDRRALVLFTDNGSLYTLTNRTDALFFASEYHPLKVLADKHGLSAAAGYALRQVPSNNGVVCALDGFGVDRFEVGSVREASSVSGSARAGTGIEIINIEDEKPQLELVRDVAVIAAAPGAERFEAMLEHNNERISKLRRCSRCILPETFPFIGYDDSGVCNYCSNYKLRNQPKPIEELLELLEPYRSRDGEPECIVPFSGGRDSTYALHFIRTQLKLNPIAFTYDWGMVTDLGRRNIARVCGKLGVENIIVAADIHRKRRNIHKNIMAWLGKPHLGMIPLFMAGDKYFYWYVDQVKRQTGIQLNVWGINPMENTDFKVGFLGVPPDFDKKHIYSLSLARQLKLFAGVSRAVLSNPGYVNSSIPDTIGSFLSRSVKPHRHYFHLYDYLRWDEQEINRVILDEYRWEKAIDTDTTWRIGDGTAAFYNYVYFNVAGFSEHDTFRSNQIREGVLSREEGLRLAEAENRPRYPTIRWYLDAVDIDFEHAIRTVNAIPKLYP